MTDFDSADLSGVAELLGLSDRAVTGGAVDLLEETGCKGPLLLAWGLGTAADDGGAFTVWRCTSALLARGLAIGFAWNGLCDCDGKRLFMFWLLATGFVAGLGIICWALDGT